MYLYIEVSFAVIADCNVIIQRESACDATKCQDSCCLLPSQGGLHVASNLVSSLFLFYPLLFAISFNNYRLLSKLSLIIQTIPYSNYSLSFSEYSISYHPFKKGFNHVISTSSPCLLGTLLHLSPSATAPPFSQRTFRCRRRGTGRLGVRNFLLLRLAMPLHHRIQDAALSLQATKQAQAQAATPGERLETESSGGWQSDLARKGLGF